MENLPRCEHELLVLLAGGNKLAFQELFGQYWTLIYSVGLRVTKSPESARDLAQEVFLKIWDNRERLPEVKNFRAYLSTIARHLALNHLEATMIRESNKNFLVAYFASSPLSPYETLERKHLRDDVQHAVRSLPSQLRQVFILHRIEGLSHDEIATRLDITPLSSKTYMVRALQLLRKRLLKNIHNILIIIYLILFLFF
ncbi:sigma-70 family RNA polymerase sigma factor [Chitinophaga polysaccharea]|uniref:RNA polymerase sigma factor n=1 Tax=Chitinophaga polysaccharea TaxID=1293035 RepID=UPI0014552226|nr:sigma-70 family RNA polymerase sigma factor [Chitinophaga polysaccharea]NLR62234.1 sigma-70 family RNA polymerase sigma factor [Chitinophaga polysaccharea]